MRRRQGMTLVELLIVVVILGAIMAMVSARLLGSLDEAELDAARMEALKQEQLEALLIARGGAPEITDTRIVLALSGTPVLDGLTARTRYTADFDGDFTIQSTGSRETVSLRFPFPAGVSEVREASLRITGPDGVSAEPAGVRYGLDAIAWSGDLPSDGPLQVSVHYAAKGIDAFRYDLLGSGRSGRVSVTAEAADGTRLAVPPEALQPTSAAAGQLSWQLDGLITEAPLVVSMPASGTPLGRLMRLMRLAGLGLFLFGGGFWYLSEEARPGSLDDFHLGGLLLLGLNYCLFFAIFAVLGRQGHAAGALAAAALLSLPLLTLHVSRINGQRFALRRALPLAALTLAATVAGAWLDDHGPMIALAAAVIAATYVTVTFRRWSGARAEWATRAVSQQRRAQREATLAQALAVLREAVCAQEGSAEQAAGVLAEAPAGLGAERAELRRRLERLQATLRRGHSLVQAASDWSAHDEPTHQRRCEQRAAEARRTAEALIRQGATAAAACDAVEQAGSASTEALYEAMGRLERALDAVGLRRIEAAGLLATSPERLKGEVAAAVARLDTLQAEAAATLAQVAAGQGQDIRAQAATAQRLTQGVTAGLSALEASTRRLEDATRRASVAEVAEAAEVACLHCPACGAAHPPGSRFCMSCGHTRPAELPCCTCGQVTRLPGWLMEPGWTDHPLHCGGCGSALAARSAGAPPQRAAT